MSIEVVYPIRFKPHGNLNSILKKWSGIYCFRCIGDRWPSHITMNVMREQLDYVRDQDSRLRNKLELSEMLMMAVESALWDAIPLLLNMGADVNHMEYFEKNCLHAAILNGAPPNTIAIMLAHNPRKDTVCIQTDSHPLGLAVERNDLDVADLLLSAGADVHFAPATYIGPSIRWAVIFGHVEMAKLLFHYKADPNYIDVHGVSLINTCIGQCTKSKSENYSLGNATIMLSTLIDYGASLADIDYRAVCEPDNFPLFELILRAYTVGKDTRSLTEVLMYTARQGNKVNMETCVQYLARVEYESSPRLDTLQIEHMGHETEKYYEKCLEELDNSKNVIFGNDTIHNFIVNKTTIRTSQKDTSKDSRDELKNIMPIYSRHVEIEWENQSVNRSLVENCSTQLRKIGMIFEIAVINENICQYFDKYSMGSIDKRLFKMRELTAQSLIHLLDNGMEINSRETFEDTLLVQAIRAERCDLVVILLGRGADPSLGRKAEEQGQPLKEAIEMNSSEIVKVLLQHGAPLNNVDGVGICILEKLKAGETQMVETLLEHGLNPDTLLQSHDRCILNHGIRYGKKTLVDLCLKHNANVNIPDYLGHTAIFLAIQKCDKFLMQKLIACGAELEVWDNAGTYLLTWTIIYENEEMVMELLASGIDISKYDIPNLRGNAAQVALSMKQTKIVEVLINMGIDLGGKNVRNENILDECLACMRSKVYPPATCASMIATLVKKGAKISDMRNYPFFPEGFFMYTTESLMTLLYELGLRIKTQTDIGETLTPVHEAYYNPDPNFITSLIENYQVDVNMRDHLGNSVLYMAANEGNVVKLDQLVKLGANLFIRNNVNQPVLIYALNSGRLESAFKWLTKRSDVDAIMFVLSYVVEWGMMDYQKCIIKFLTLKYASGHLNDIQALLMNACPKCLPLYEQYAAELRLMDTYYINGVSLVTMLKAAKRSSLGADRTIVGIIEKVALEEIFPLYWTDLVRRMNRCADYQTLADDAARKLSKMTPLLRHDHTNVIEHIWKYLTDFDLLKLSEVNLG
ncbi:hypothetical protein QAD02_017721 [Eretmocerus hayati]|uniref:Uncharacterized protein n=1 Tax=Eretmocerus hayati TaxID=131215 RepID=A0ACC2PF57_9HYME|nr:hypothetical protein QAD02_017721 [Eretmocerus hayati]